MKKKKRRLLSVLLCLALTIGLTVPTYAATDGLDFQYVFEKDFTFSGFSSVQQGWYSVPLDVTDVAQHVKADYILFTIDGNSFRTEFKSASRGTTYHYIGNAYPLFGFGEETDEPYCLIICPDSPGNNKLYLRSDFFSPLFHGDIQAIHVALSVGYNDLFATGGFLDDVRTVFASALNMVGSVADVVISKPILLVPVALGLASIGIVFYRRLKN